MRNTPQMNLATYCTPEVQEPDKVCKKLNISEYLFHRQYLQVRGIYVADKPSSEFAETFTIANEFHLGIFHPKIGGNIIPAKLPIYPQAFTPYRFSNGHLYFLDQQILTHYLFTEVPLPEVNQPRYLKGFSFPHFGTNNPFYALRVNPRTSGLCPGKCDFCHRTYSQRARSIDRPKIISPEEIVDKITQDYGVGVFSKVRYVTFVTELFGNEDQYLDYIEKFLELIVQHGYSSEGEFNCVAQDVRSKKGLERLYRLLNPKRYQYTLEMFSNRDTHMSKYKGLPLNQVFEVLAMAREVGFEEIQLNYIAGIDSLEDFNTGLVHLHKLHLVDSIGFNVLTAFFSDQLLLRREEGWFVEYYYFMTQMIKQMEIPFYKPESFEMGSPFALI